MSYIYKKEKGRGQTVLAFVIGIIAIFYTLNFYEGGRVILEGLGIVLVFITANKLAGYIMHRNIPRTGDAREFHF